MEDTLEKYAAITMISELIRSMSDPKMDNAIIGVGKVIDILIEAREKLQAEIMTDTLNSIKKFTDSARYTEDTEYLDTEDLMEGLDG